MTARNDEQSRQDALAVVIRKGINTRANRGVLARMPVFRTEGTVPDRFVSLLDGIDEAERSRDNDNRHVPGRRVADCGRSLS